MPHLKKAGAPGPRSTSSRLLSSSFFPPSLPPTSDCCSVFLLLCLSALSQAALLCHNQLCSVTTGHLLCQPHCHTRFLYRAAKKSAATSPALFKPCLFLFQKSQLLGLSVTVMFVRFFEHFFFSLIFSTLFVHHQYYPPYPPLIPKPRSTSSSSSSSH